MSIKDWSLGQRVTVHFPHANQGAPKSQNTVITKIGRKYISVHGLQAEFDATLDVPRSSHDELYTANGYIEDAVCQARPAGTTTTLGTAKVPDELAYPIRRSLGY